jgi:hypothetical protein
MARRLSIALLATLLGAPLLARAQTNPASGQVTIVESADANENPPIINIAECNGDTADTLTYYFNVPAGTTYGLFLANVQGSSEACPAVTSTTQTVNSVTIVPNGTTIPAVQNVVDDSTIGQRLQLPVGSGGLGLTCEGSGVTTVYLCLNTNTTTFAASGSITLDLARPATPAGVTLRAGDTQLHVSWSRGSGGASSTSGYRVRWGVSGGALSSSHDLDGESTTSYDIPNLANGTAYDVQVAALSRGKNESPFSDVQSDTPVEIDDFWRLYRNDGGREQGGCATGAGGLAAAVALLALAARRRGRRS